MSDPKDTEAKILELLELHRRQDDRDKLIRDLRSLNALKERQLVDIAIRLAGMQ